MPIASSCQLAVRIAAVLLALAGLLTVPGGVGVALAKSAVGECRGQDMLAELAAAEASVAEVIAAAGRAVGNQEALLWRIEREGLPPSHLFGTIHVTDRRASTMAPAVITALDAAQTVAVEVEDVSAAATGKAMAEANALVLFTDGGRLDRLVGPDVFAKAKAAVRSTGMPTASLNRFKPWMVTLILAVGACERTALDRGAKVLDQVIIARAKARKIPVASLETLVEQLAAAAAVPLDDQVEMFKATVAFADRSDDLSETILQLYLDRRIGAALPFQAHLTRQAGARADAVLSFRREMIEKRNRIMAERALPLLAKGGVFVAVGALHLPDADGLVALFREAGYTVTAVE